MSKFASISRKRHYSHYAYKCVQVWIHNNWKEILWEEQETIEALREE